MHCELTANISTRELSDYFNGRVKTSCTKYLKILYFCFNKIVFVQGDSASLTDIRELKQATFLSTRTAAGSKLRRQRWQMMASAVLV